jgi:hypothetical protein
MKFCFEKLFRDFPNEPSNYLLIPLLFAFVAESERTEKSISQSLRMKTESENEEK